MSVGWAVAGEAGGVSDGECGAGVGGEVPERPRRPVAGSQVHHSSEDCRYYIYLVIIRQGEILPASLRVY